MDDDIRVGADSMAALRGWRLARPEGFRRLVGLVSEGAHAQLGKDGTTGQALEETGDPTRQAEGPQG
jgi:hypothetical protein